jgi:membrane-bound lytic murein transglycosylase B
VKKIVLLISTCALLIGANVASAGYDQHERFNEFAKELEAEHGIKAAQTKIWLAQAFRVSIKCYFTPSRKNQNLG